MLSGRDIYCLWGRPSELWVRQNRTGPLLIQSPAGQGAVPLNGSTVSLAVLSGPRWTHCKKIVNLASDLFCAQMNLRWTTWNYHKFSAGDHRLIVSGLESRNLWGQDMLSTHKTSKPTIKAAHHVALSKHVKVKSETETAGQTFNKLGKEIWNATVKHFKTDPKELHTYWKRKAGRPVIGFKLQSQRAHFGHKLQNFPIITIFPQP